MRAVKFLAALLFFCAVTTQAYGGTVYASLSASPSSINEGGSTQLTLSLSHSPYSSNQYIYSYGGFDWAESRRYTGVGGINSFSGGLNPGDARPSTSLSGGNGSNSASASSILQYTTPGSYMANFSGSANLWDQTYTFGYYYTYGSFGNRFYNPYSYYSTSGNGALINASTQVHVGNLSPTIADIDWNPLVMVNELFDFSSFATDPAGIAGNELLTFGYDFNSDGVYTDYLQSGSPFSSGSYSFSTAGTYTVGIRVTDGLGGQTFGSFDVTVRDLPSAPEAVPEPSAIAIWSVLGCVAAGGHWWRKRKGA